jgi:hypothetical protein
MQQKKVWLNFAGKENKTEPAEQLLIIYVLLKSH